MENSLYNATRFNSGEVEARIVYLLTECDPDDVSDPANALEAHERRELNFLTDMRSNFHEEVGYKTPGWEAGDVTIIRTMHALAEYVRDKTEEVNEELMAQIGREMPHVKFDWLGTATDLALTVVQFKIGDDMFYADYLRNESEV